MRNALHVALSALLAAALASTADAQARRALVIGNADYREPAAGAADSGGRRSFGDLRGAVNDAQAFREVLVARYGFEGDDVRLVLNAEATREGILASVREHLIEPSEPGDVAVLYYAGHGSQIRNSKNEADLDGLDQTLVPHDSAAGALDIWDKELRALLNDLLDTGARVTAFFDSCHSGSITRGLPREERTRFAPVDERDAAELYAFVPDDEREAPESRGALVLSAAQDFQTAKESSDDDGTYHGLFSQALLRVLRTVPIDEPASRVLKRTRAIMQSDGCSQEPVLAGLDAARPLFGPAPEGASGRMAVAVQAVVDGRCVLQGGRALGLGAGTELAGEDGARLCIEEVLDLTSSTAAVLEGDAESIEPGDLFEVDRWVPPSEAHLRVWIPEALAVEPSELEALLERVGALDGVALVRDPTQVAADAAPDHVLEAEADGWRLARPLAGEVLGRGLDAEGVVAALSEAAERGPLNLLVNVPPPPGLRESLAFSDVDADSAIEIVESPADAHYLLVGRVREVVVLEADDHGVTEQVLQYAWVLPGGWAAADARDLALPVRTDWITLRDGDVDAAAARLRRHALRTGRVRAWLRLEGPPADKRFPWRLALRDAESGRVHDGGTVRDEGRTFELALVTDAPPRVPQRRYVYVFAIDSHGRSTLLFPGIGAGPNDNLVPPPGLDRKATEIVLSHSPITVRPPYGTDTIVMLSTKDEALQDPHALEWEPVLSTEDKSRTRGERGRGVLDRLLTSALGPTRSARVDAPTDWSITRMQIVTEGPPAGRAVSAKE